MMAEYTINCFPLLPQIVPSAYFAPPDNLRLTTIVTSIVIVIVIAITINITITITIINDRTIAAASQAGVTSNYLAHKMIEHNSKPRIIRTTVGCPLSFATRIYSSYTCDS